MLTLVFKISWTLDPEEYDYIIPNNGFVGFRLMLTDNLIESIPKYDSIMAGPFYQTNVKIKLFKVSNLMFALILIY